MAYNTNLNTEQFAEFFNLSVMQDWPAVRIYRGDDSINFDHDDKIYVDLGRSCRGMSLMNEFRIWTRQGLEAKYGADDNWNEPEVGASGCSVMLTAEARAKEHRIGYVLGDIITVRSKQYRIDRAPNDNIWLVAI